MTPRSHFLKLQINARRQHDDETAGKVDSVVVVVADDDDELEEDPNGKGISDTKSRLTL